jgi:hypothetical protein
MITPTRHSSWVANLVPIRKKIGEIRLCVIFKNLNQLSLKDNYPLPNMHLLQKVTMLGMMSMLDGVSSFNQVLVKEEEQHKTTLLCHVVHVYISRCHLVC